MSKVWPKRGDKVRLTLEGTVDEANDTYFDIDDLHCFWKNEDNLTVEILKPEPKPGEAWVITLGLDERVAIKRAHGWIDAHGPFSYDEVTPLRRLVDPGEDGSPA